MDNTILVRLTVFLGVFTCMAVLEALMPARHPLLSRKDRWPGNLSMVIIGALVSRSLLPTTLVGVSMWAQREGVGLFNAIKMDVVESPGSGPEHIAVIALCILLLDMVIYWQHRFFHTIPILWRFHKMHHADSHVDTTTGLRFHPVEIAISLAIKAAAVVLFGIPAVAIVIFEVALNGFALFNHANIRLPQKWDEKLSWLLITQRVHRIHHSQDKAESNSNFGFSVSCWDRLFNSFTPRAHYSDETLPVGQKDVPARKENAGVLALLLQPFNEHSSK